MRDTMRRPWRVAMALALMAALPVLPAGAN